MSSEERRGVVREWGRSGWALADQAVVSFGSAATTIMLARTLSAHEYGVFILLLGMLLFLNGLHASLVTFPLSLKAGSADGGLLAVITGESLVLTATLSGPLSVGVVVLAILVGQPSLAFWTAAAMALWQMQETLRRALMARLRHREAFPGDALRYLGQAAAVVWLARSGMLTLNSAFITIAGAAAAGSIVQAAQLRPALNRLRQVTHPALEHWQLGRWVLLTNLNAIATLQVVPWTLGYFHGSAEVAKFGLLIQVMALANPVVMSIAGLIVPAVATAAATRPTTAWPTAMRYLAQGGILLAPYWAFLLLFPHVALRFFSGGNSTYSDLPRLLPWVVVAYVFAVPAQLAQGFLNGLGRTRLSFAAQCAFSAATLAVSVPLSIVWGVNGAVWGGLVPAFVYLVTTARLVWWTQRTRIPSCVGKVPLATGQISAVPQGTAQ